MNTQASKNREVSQSLDADERLLPFLPFLLQDLGALGFGPEPMVRLLRSSALAGCRGVRLLDLGCGKGAALIRLAQEFGWSGEGVDLIPEFIAEARRRAQQAGVADRLRFEVADIGQAVRQGGAVDVILFGCDSGVLGSLEECLTVLRTRLACPGYIVLDTVWTAAEELGPAGAAPSEARTRSAVRAAGLDVAGQEILDARWVHDQNHANTEHIRRRALELGRRFPDKKSWFDDYVRRQEQECRELEEELVCSILLLAA
jgi:SAM-dependent methyltransferase